MHFTQHACRDVSKHFGWEHSQGCTNGNILQVNMMSIYGEYSRRKIHIIKYYYRWELKYFECLVYPACHKIISKEWNMKNTICIHCSCYHWLILATLKLQKIQNHLRHFDSTSYQTFDDDTWWNQIFGHQHAEQTLNVKQKLWIF